MSAFTDDLGAIALGGAESLPFIGSGIAGIGQSLQANRIHPIRPTYQIPQQILNNVGMYNAMANTSRLPGAGLAENNIYGNQASLISKALQTGGSAGDILASLQGIGANTNNALNNLAFQGAQYQTAAKDRLAAANNELANYKNMAFDYNQNQPYEQEYAKKMALQGGALGNFNTTSQNLGNLAMTAFGVNGGMGGLGGGSGASATTAKKPGGFFGGDLPVLPLA